MTPGAGVARRATLALDAVTVALLLTLIYLGKRFYSGAGVGDLVWILAPTAQLTGWLVGGHFEPELGYGFVDTELRFAIVPACAGVNFLLAALGLLGAGLLLGELRPGQRLRRGLLVAVAAYSATVIANALRIALAVAWHVRQPELGWLTEARWHRIEGVAVYLVALLVLHELAGAWRRRADGMAS